MVISERYKKALVTVAMGLRTEEDIRKNGLYRFCKSDKDELINFAKELFSKKSNLLALKIKPTGYRSEHINITTPQELQTFFDSLDEIFCGDNEVWIVSSSSIDCWRCRIYLSDNAEISDKFEMAYSSDDHILDHLDYSLNNIKYLCWVKNNKTNTFELQKSTVDIGTEKQCYSIVEDVVKTYKYEFRDIKLDIQALGIGGISLDCRVNNGYDFHDFDVSYGDVKKVVDFYTTPYIQKHYK